MPIKPQTEPLNPIEIVLLPFQTLAPLPVLTIIPSSCKAILGFCIVPPNPPRVAHIPNEDESVPAVASLY